MPPSNTPPPLPFGAAMVDGLVPAEPAAVVVNRKRPGPQRKLTPDMVPVAERSFKAGMTQTNVAHILGVSPRCLTKWLADADEDGCTDDLLLEFAAACRAGRAAALRELTEYAMDHAKEDGRVCVKLLEVLNPDFNVTKNVKVDATVSGPALVDLSGLTDEEFAAVQRGEELKELAAARAKALKA